MQTAQLPLVGILPPAPPSHGLAQKAAALAPTVEEDSTGVTVSSRGLQRGSGCWALRFDASTALLCGWASGGREVLAAPLAPCFYRAPTDNDKGGSGGSSYSARWVGGWARQFVWMRAVGRDWEEGPAAVLSALSVVPLRLLSWRLLQPCLAGGRRQGLTVYRWRLAVPASVSASQTAAMAAWKCAALSACAPGSSRRLRRQKWQRVWGSARCADAPAAAAAVQWCLPLPCRLACVALLWSQEGVNPLLPALYTSCVQVGGAHWLSEAQPNSVNVEAAEQDSGRTEGSIACEAVYTGASGGSML